MLTGIWQAFLTLIGIVDKGEDIIKSNQGAAQTDRDQKQGEQNANAKTTADGLKTVIDADRAYHEPAVLDRVRAELRRP